MNKIKINIFFKTLVLVIFSGSLDAAVYQWGGSGSTTITPDLNLNTNWQAATVPGSGDQGVFQNLGNHSPTLNDYINLQAFVEAAPNVTPYQFTIGSGGFIQYSGTGFVSANLSTNTFNLTNDGRIDFALGASAASNQPVAYTLNDSALILFEQNSQPGNASFNFNSTTARLTFNNNANITVSSPITGTTGSGTLISGVFISPTVSNITTIFTGSGVKTYSGQTGLNRGTLQAGSTNAFSANSDLILSAANTTLNLNNFTNTIGSLSGTFSSSIVNLGNADLTTGGTNATTTYAGSIIGTGVLAKDGTGVFTLSGPSLNTYSGASKINSGTLQSGALNSFSPNSQVQLFGTAILDLNNNNNTIASLTGNNGTQVTLGTGTLTTGADNTTTSFAGTITGTGGLTKNGTGEFTLNGTSNGNTYSGTTTINAGTLGSGSVNSFSANSAIVMTGSSILNLNGNNNVIASLTGTATNQVTLGGGGILTTGGNNTSTTYAGAITGNGGIVKNGSGVFTLSGSGLNTYNSATTINAGTLRSGATNSFSPNSPVFMTGTSILDLNNNDNTIAALTGTATNQVTLGSSTLTTGNALSTTYAGTITGTGGLTKNGSGTFTLSRSGSNTYTGTTTINAGTLQSGATNSFSAASNVTMTGTSILNLNNFDNTIGSLSGTSGNVVSLGSGTLTTSSATNTTYAGAITGSGGIVKNGTGTLTLSGPSLNTYSGSTIINQGTLQSGTTNSFSANSTVIMIGSSILDLNNFNNTIGSLTGTSTNTVTLGSGTLTTGANNASTTYAGAIIGTGSLTKNGIGTFTLSGSGLNTYSGTTTLNAGTLRAGGTNVLPINSTVVMTGNSILDLNNFDSTIGSLSGTVINQVLLGSGTLTTGGNNSSTIYFGSITGTGGLTKNGTGTFTLGSSNLNTYSGTTTINQGTLQAGLIDSFSPNSAVVMTGTSILDLNNNNNQIASLAGSSENVVTLGSGTLTTGSNNTSTLYAGAITGTGGLTKTGTGVFTLSGSNLNTYSGTTSLNSGTLQAGAVNSFSSASVLVMTGNSILNLNGFNNAVASLSGNVNNQVILSVGTLTTGGNNSSTTYSGKILGNGGLTKNGTGIFTLTGSGQNTYTGNTTINGGTLRAGSANSFAPDSNVIIGSAGTLDSGAFSNKIGALAGASGSTVNVTAPATLTFGNSGISTFAGSFTGSGNLQTTGSGTFFYTGNSPAFTGTTTIGNTLYSLNGFLGGNAIVSSNSTLAGNGTIGGNLIVNSGATISPGNSIGTINVNGNYTQNADSTYIVEINNLSQNDLINVGGTATLNGGVIQIATNSAINLFQNYVILNANGGVNGTFQGVTSSFSNLIKASLIYTPNQVLINAQTSIINAACSQNAKKIATILDNIQNISPELLQFLNKLISIDPNDVCTVLNEMTGQQYSLAFVTAESNGRQLLRRLYDPLRPILTNVPCINDLCDNEICSNGTTWMPWFEIGGGSTSIQGNKNVKGLNLNNVEVSLGFQGTKDEYTLGIAGSFDRDKINYRLNGSGKCNTSYLALYGLYRSPLNYPSFRWYVLGDLAYGFVKNHVKRHIDVGDLRYKVKGSYNINQVFAYAESGFDLYLKCFLVQPFLGLEAGGMIRNGIHEKGSTPFNLSIKGNMLNNAYTRLGCHLTTNSSEFTFLNDYYRRWARLFPTITLAIDLAWACRLTDSAGYNLSEQFQSLGDKIKIKGYKNHRNAFDYAVTASTDLFDDWKFYVEASGSIFWQNTTYEFLGGVTYSW